MLARSLSYLWRVRLDDSGPPERIESAGLGAIMPATVGSRDRLAFVRYAYDEDIYRFEIGHPARPVVTSSFADAGPHLSPDGRHLAFSSARSGDRPEIWVADQDGSAAHQLTRGPGQWQGSPRWSPDGRTIAFDSLSDDRHWHLWVVDADGGSPRRLTSDSGDENVPTWSHDGRWIYYSLDRGQGKDICRTPATGGTPQKLTRGGSGTFACESADGKSLVYQPRDENSPLLKMPLGGGPTTQVVKCAAASAFTVTRDGVYYVECARTPDRAVHLLDPGNRRDRVLGTLEQFESNVPTMGLAVSPAGTIFYTRHVRDSADLMLIENFR
jgi:Tol biopolymer transport system component